MKNWKTYLGAAGMLLTGIYMIIEGKYEEGVAMISGALGLVGLRHKLQRSAPDS